MNFNRPERNNDHAPKLIRFSYSLGLIATVISIYLSGFENNPRKYKPRLDLNSQINRSSPSNQIDFVKLETGIPSSLEKFNSKGRKTSQTIKIPISLRETDGTGTAFLLGPGIWITARHVINGCKKVFLGKENVDRIYLPNISDLALIQLEGDKYDYFGFNGFPYVKENFVESTSLNLGDEGYSMGFPKGNPGQAQLRFSGYVRMIQQGDYYADEPVRVWIEQRRQPRNLDQMGGISGGPIFDNNGKIAGVHVANSIRKGRAFSVDVPSLFSFVSTYDEKYSTNLNFIEKPIMERITPENWINVADKWRSEGLIKKVFCFL